MVQWSCGGCRVRRVPDDDRCEECGEALKICDLRVVDRVAVSDGGEIGSDREVIDENAHWQQRGEAIVLAVASSVVQDLLVGSLLGAYGVYRASSQRTTSTVIREQKSF